MTSETPNFQPRYEESKVVVATDVSPLLEKWKNAGWQVIVETPLAPAMNVALDEVLTAQVGAGRRPPTLRFWGWGGRRSSSAPFNPFATRWTHRPQWKQMWRL